MKLAIKKNLIYRLGAGLSLIFMLIFFLKYKQVFIWEILFFGLPGFILSYALTKRLHFLERVLLGFPIGCLMLIPLNYLSDAGVSLRMPLILFFLIALPIIAGILLHRPLRQLKSSDFNPIELFNKYAKYICILGIILLMTVLIWQPLLQGDKLPLTDQIPLQSLTWHYYYGLEDPGQFPLWISELSGGYPITVFDSPFHYQRLAIFHMLTPSTEMSFDQNTYAFLSAFLINLGIFCLARRFKQGSWAGFIAILFFITNPFLASKFGYSGDIRELVTLAYVPVLFILMFEALEGDYKQYLTLALVGASTYYTHSVTLTFAVLLLALIFVLYKVLHKIVPEKKAKENEQIEENTGAEHKAKNDWVANLKQCISNKEIMWIVIAGIVAVLLVAMHVIPFLSYIDYSHFDKWGWQNPGTLDAVYEGFLKPAMDDATIGQFGEQTFLYFFILGIIGMGICVYRNPRHYLSIIFFAFALLLLCYAVPGLNALLKNTHYERLRSTYLIMFALAIPFIYKIGSTFKFGKELKVVAKVVTTIVLLGFVVHYGAINATWFDNWVNEGAQNGMFKEHYDYLESIGGDGRLTTFGIFAYAVEMAIPFVSDNLGMITHSHYPGTYTNVQEEIKDESESGPNRQLPMMYQINRMKTFWGKYILVYKGPGRGGPQIAQMYDQMQAPPFNLMKVRDAQDVSLYVIPNSSYSEKVSISKINMTKQDAYSAENGWKVWGFADEGSYEKYGYDQIISSMDDVNALPDPIANNAYYKDNRQDHIIIEGKFEDGDWVILKDHIFPRWHAYMVDAGGKEVEVPIVESNLGTMLIKTIDGDRIEVINRVTSRELQISLLSSVSLIAVFVLLALAPATMQRYKSKKKARAQKKREKKEQQEKQEQQQAKKETDEKAKAESEDKKPQ